MVDLIYGTEMSQSEASILETITRITGVEPSLLKPELKVGEVDGWDSISHLSFMVELGQQFGFDVDATVLAEVQSIGDILKLAGA